MSAVSAAGCGVIVRFPCRPASPGFTARDRSELEGWAGHAGRAFTMVDEDGTSLAMLYDGTTPWASWAVTRQDAELLVWDCVTFADIGRFACMAEALAAVSGSDPLGLGPVSNVVAFASLRLHREPMPYGSARPA